jgi:hypothetical protein
MGTPGIPFKSGVIPTAETAEVDAIGCMLAIAGLGDVPDNTNLFWRGTFERFDGPQCSICEPAEERLTILERGGGGGMILVSVVSPTQKACGSRVPKGRLCGGGVRGGGISGAFGKMCVDISGTFNTTRRMNSWVANDLPSTNEDFDT